MKKSCFFHQDLYHCEYYQILDLSLGKLRHSIDFFMTFCAVFFIHKLTERTKFKLYMGRTSDDLGDRFLY